MYIKVERNSFADFMENAWSGAVPVLKQVEEKGLEEEFLAIIEEIFGEDTPTDTEVNDFIWFELESFLPGLWEDNDADEEEEDE